MFMAQEMRGKIALLRPEDYFIRAGIFIGFVILILSFTGFFQKQVVLGNPDSDTFRPNVAGYITDWSVSGTTTHSGATSDLSDTTYIYSSTKYQGDFLNLDDPIFNDTANINWVQTHYNCRSLNGKAGPEKIDLYLRSGSDFETNVNQAVDRNGYVEVTGTQQTSNPVSGQPWTKADITSLQIGMFVDSVDSGEEIRCSELWVVVDYTDAIISVTVASGTVNYGFLGLGATTTTILKGQTQTVTNNGNVTENITISSSDATGGTTWNLASVIGAQDDYIHKFSSTTGASWSAFATDHSYSNFFIGLGASATSSLDFWIQAPSDTTDYQEKSITVTVQASAP